MPQTSTALVCIRTYRKEKEHVYSICIYQEHTTNGELGCVRQGLAALVLASHCAFAVGQISRGALK